MRAYHIKGLANDDRCNWLAQFDVSENTVFLVVWDNVLQTFVTVVADDETAVVDLLDATVKHFSISSVVQQSIEKQFVFFLTKSPERYCIGVEIGVQSARPDEESASFRHTIQNAHCLCFPNIMKPLTVLVVHSNRDRIRQYHTVYLSSENCYDFIELPSPGWLYLNGQSLFFITFYQVF